MKENIEFLNYVYQNAQMGVVGIDDISSKIENEKLEKIISTQRSEYEKIMEDALVIFKKYGKEKTDISAMAKMSSFMMSKMKLAADASSSAIAKMMIEGSNKGIIEITEKLNYYIDADEEIIDLAKKLLKTEESNLDDLKEFL